MTTEFYNIIAEERVKPFKYGSNDCALFCNNVYKRVFGIDIAGSIAGSYNDEYHAARTLVKLGRWDGILLSKGFIKVEKNYINVGDVVTCEGALGIYVGDGRAIFAGNTFRTLDKIETVYTYKG